MAGKRDKPADIVLKLRQVEVWQELAVSERRACRTLGRHRSTQRKVPQG
jgi:hypothetical protein